MTDLEIGGPKNDAELRECLILMKVLRPHLSDLQRAIEQIKRQAAQGYALLAAWQGAEVVGLAGYRFQENLLYGRFLYVDDLVTAESLRSQGIGSKLIDALARIARNRDCRMLVLDTGAQNGRAQQFYRRQGMDAAGMHFTRVLN